MENCTELKSESVITEDVKINKKGNFLTSYYGFFVIPLVTFILFAIALYANGVWPFGDAIIASYDMLAQVCPILEHFFDVIQGESDIFHTFHLGGGMDMFGILAYCAVSPFTFMFLIAGEGGSIYMVSIVLPMKYAFIGLSAFIFLRRYFKAIPQYLQVVLALLYAFSGYSYVANTYIIWMDLMIWMPLLLAGFIEFVRTKKIRWLVIGIAINVYTCFSIVCFSLMIVFPIFICYFLICKPKKELREYISKLCLAFVVAIALSLPILLPALMSYMQAGRNTGLFSRVFSVLSESAFKDGDLGLPIYEKFAYIVCDSAFIVLMVIYFFRSKKSDKLSSFMPIVFIYLIFPCLIDESMLLLNMGSYYSYALRFGFLNSIFLLFVSAKCLEGILADIKDDEVSEKNNNVFSLIMMLLTVGAVLFTTLFYRYIANGDYENSKIIKLIFGSNEEMQPFKDFFPLFAHSEGGLETTIILFIVVVLVFIIAGIFVKHKLIKFKDLVCFLCVLSLSQSVFFTFSMVKGDKLTQSAPKFDYYAEMIDQIAEEDDELYRLKSYDYYISSDSPLILGSYSHTLFSSMADAKNITAPKFFGYKGSLTNSTRSNGGTKFSDSLLSYKYMIVEVGNFNASAVKNSLYKPTDIIAHKTPSVKVSTTTMNSKSGSTETSTKVNTWENISAENHGRGEWSSLKIAVSGNKFKGYLNGELIYSLTMVSSEITDVSLATKSTFGSAKNLTVSGVGGNNLDGNWVNSTWTEEDGVYSNKNETSKLKFNGDLSNFKEFSADVCFDRGTASDDYIGIEITAKQSDVESRTYRIVIEPNVAYRVYVNEYSFPMAAVINSGELVFEEGDTKTEKYQTLTTLLNGGEPLGINSSSVPDDKIKELYNKLSETAVKFELVKSGIKFQTINAQKGQMLYLNYVNLKGYKAYVNGKERPLKQNSLDFIFVELDEGENIVEITYKSPYKSFILIGIALSAFIIFACYIVYKKKSIIFEKLSGILFIMGLSLALALTVFFFIFPLGIFFKKIFVDYGKILIKL